MPFKGPLLTFLHGKQVVLLAKRSQLPLCLDGQGLSVLPSRRQDLHSHFREAGDSSSVFLFFTDATDRREGDGELTVLCARDMAMMSSTTTATYTKKTLSVPIKMATE